MTGRRHGPPADADSAGADSAERSRAVLEQRARALAQPRVEPDTRDGLGLITFLLDQEVYAVESRFVREVCRLTELTAVPGTDQTISGLTLWRGELVPVVDLRSLLGLPAARTPAAERRTLVLLDGSGGAGGAGPLVAVGADAPGELREVPEPLVRRPPDGGAASEYVRGMLADGVLVLDAARVWDVVGSESG